MCDCEIQKNQPFGQDLKSYPNTVLLVCYQKSTNEALIETNHIVLSLQKNVNINNVIEENNYFDKIELNSLKKTSYVQYSLTTIKHYRCDINFFYFSNKDIITTVNFCSNI